MNAVPALPPLLGLAVRPLPLAPLQAVCSLLLDSILSRHPSILDRLGEHAGKRFAIQPTDLPCAFLLDTTPGGARVTVIRNAEPAGADASIAGPILGLIGLVDGGYDGDALFFSRDLSLDGDVAAVVALRNAIDDAGIDLVGDGARAFGPLAPVAEMVARPAFALMRAALGDAGASKEARRWS